MGLLSALNLGIVIEEFAEAVDLRSKKLKEVLRFDLGVKITINKKNKIVVAKLSTLLQELKGILLRILFCILFNYYDMYTAYLCDKQIKMLIELNRKSVGL